ncbi:MAG: hypothetical protein V2I33_23715 [Kangiellaceae bacterium]|jgi:hypothetical protein|nr:hypothetical protein [Kangiellaceae bacterium]
MDDVFKTEPLPDPDPNDFNVQTLFRFEIEFFVLLLELVERKGE